MLRFEKITTEKLVDFKSEKHHGQYHVLLSVEEAYLLVESSSSNKEFLYVDNAVAIRLPIDHEK